MLITMRSLLVHCLLVPCLGFLLYAGANLRRGLTERVVASGADGTISLAREFSWQVHNQAEVGVGVLQMGVALALFVAWLSLRRRHRMPEHPVV